MNNHDFYELQNAIQVKIYELADLQKQHRDLTGSNFVNGQRIKAPLYCDTCKHNQEDGNGFFCNCEESKFYENRDPKLGCADHDEEDGG